MKRIFALTLALLLMIPVLATGAGKDTAPAPPVPAATPAAAPAANPPAATPVPATPAKDSK
jgi:hypothetical protein